MNQKDQRSFRDLAEQEILSLGLPTNTENEKLILQLKIHERELELQHEALETIQAELEERNRQFTQLFRDAPIPYLLLDPEGTILLANQSAINFLQQPGQALRSDSELQGSQLILYFQPQDRAIVSRHIAQVVETGRGRIEEILVPEPSGGSRWCSIESSREAQENRWIFMILYDVTSKKTMEDDLILAQNQAVQANRLKNLFLANLTHELRGAFTSILHLAQAADPEAAGKTEGPLPALQATAQGTLRLIEDILDFTASEDGTLSIRPRPFDFGLLIDHIRERFAPQAEGKNLTLHCRTQIPHDILLESDEDRLRQILTNLVQNAITYTETGRIDLIASYRPITDFMGELDLEVRDTGKGISQAILRDIWQGPGLEMDQYQRKTSGPGLGLPLCKRITKLLGGQIYLNSNPGFGTSVYVNLPIHSRKSLPETPSSPRPLRQSGPEAPVAYESPATLVTDSIHVLVAEDNDLNRIVLVNILKGLGYSRVSTAREGREALEVLRAQPDINLILMDISMPGMDGLQAARHIRAGRAGNPDTPIIAVSAHSLKGDNQSFLKAGLNYHIIKPYTRLHVQKAIETVLTTRLENLP
ncbi:MAG: response regulator [Spirochaetales bacterium]|nr:response regulator [Spirochaetales bacterium]